MAIPGCLKYPLDSKLFPMCFLSLWCVIKLSFPKPRFSLLCIQGFSAGIINSKEFSIFSHRKCWPKIVETCFKAPRFRNFSWLAQVRNFLGLAVACYGARFHQFHPYMSPATGSLMRKNPFAVVKSPLQPSWFPA